ncbi:hypothetical protein IRJ41_018634 [Triplophysa rosa]|uniref:Uncharacterized protein n=1 Tax=Triplophysa rosa TaxID=992332 RepID=A0A9W7T7Z8_TRIRA|nr:hypothetical protein IRJ41_018634 [Triplophysa rosa]
MRTDTANNDAIDHAPTQRDGPDAETDFPAITRLTSVPRSQCLSSSARPGCLNGEGLLMCRGYEGLPPVPASWKGQSGPVMCLDACPSRPSLASRKVAASWFCASICWLKVKCRSRRPRGSLGWFQLSGNYQLESLVYLKLEPRQVPRRNKRTRGRQAQVLDECDTFATPLEMLSPYAPLLHLRFYPYKFTSDDGTSPSPACSPRKR